MCVYIFSRFTLKILGQALLLWFIVCFFTLKYCYLLLSLFISIAIISIIISIITVTIAKYIVINFQFFNTLTTYILANCWFKIWFPFCLFFVVCLFVCFLGVFFCLLLFYFFFVNSMLSFFVNFSNFTLCHFSFPIAFRLSELTATAVGEFKKMNSSGIVYPYLSNPIGKPFLVSIFLSCSLQIMS